MSALTKQPRSSDKAKPSGVSTKGDLDAKFGKGIAWRCDSCGCVLGIISPDHEWLCIKFKDDYTYIQGGNVIKICRRCGFWNHLSDESAPPQPDGRQATPV